MSENSEGQYPEISQRHTLDEIAELWDTHSLADYWEETEEVQFTVRAKRRRRVVMDPDVYQQVELQARQRGILPETLITLWVAERLAEAT